VGFGTPVPLLVGIVLVLLGVGLFFLDNFKPGYKRDSDTVYAILLLTVGILSLLIWNAGFAEALQLMVSAGTIIALMIERIQNRSALASMRQQGNNGAPYREEERPNRSYRGGFEEDFRPDVRAELDDDLMPLTNEVSRRRIRGSREGRGSAARDAYTQDAYIDQLADEARSTKRTSRRSSRSYDDDAYGGPLQLGGEEAESGYVDTYTAPVEPSRNRRRGRSADAAEEGPSSRSKRRRPRPNTGDRPIDGDYVDYKPLDTPKYPPGSGDEFDNSSHFDDEPQFN
jgi:hypothetical protein